MNAAIATETRDATKTETLQFVIGQRDRRGVSRVRQVQLAVADSYVEPTPTSPTAPPSATGPMSGNYLGTFTYPGGNSFQMDATLGQSGDSVAGMWCYFPSDPIPGNSGFITGTIDRSDPSAGFGRLKASFAGEDAYAMDATIMDAEGRTFAGTFDCAVSCCNNCIPKPPTGTVTFTRKMMDKMRSSREDAACTPALVHP